MEKPPEEPADHADDFCRRYAEDLEILAGQVMLDLGIPDDQIGAAILIETGSTTLFSPTNAREAAFRQQGKSRSIPV